MADAVPSVTDAASAATGQLPLGQTARESQDNGPSSVHERRASRASASSTRSGGGRSHADAADVPAVAATASELAARAVTLVGADPSLAAPALHFDTLHHRAHSVCLYCGMLLHTRHNGWLLRHLGACRNIPQCVMGALDRRAVLDHRAGVGRFGTEEVRQSLRVTGWRTATCRTCNARVVGTVHKMLSHVCPTRPSAAVNAAAGAPVDAAVNTPIDAAVTTPIDAPVEATAAPAADAQAGAPVDTPSDAAVAPASATSSGAVPTIQLAAMAPSLPNPTPQALQPPDDSGAAAPDQAGPPAWQINDASNPSVHFRGRNERRRCWHCHKVLKLIDPRKMWRHLGVCKGVSSALRADVVRAAAEHHAQQYPETRGRFEAIGVAVFKCKTCEATVRGALGPSSHRCQLRWQSGGGASAPAGGTTARRKRRRDSSASGGAAEERAHATRKRAHRADQADGMQSGNPGPGASLDPSQHFDKLSAQRCQHCHTLIANPSQNQLSFHLGFCSALPQALRAELQAVAASADDSTNPGAGSFDPREHFSEHRVARCKHCARDLLAPDNHVKLCFHLGLCSGLSEATRAALASGGGLAPSQADTSSSMVAASSGAQEAPRPSMSSVTMRAAAAQPPPAASPTTPSAAPPPVPARTSTSAEALVAANGARTTPAASTLKPAPPALAAAPAAATAAQAPPSVGSRRGMHAHVRENAGPAMTITSPGYGKVGKIASKARQTALAAHSAAGSTVAQPPPLPRKPSFQLPRPPVHSLARARAAAQALRRGSDNAAGT